MHRPEHTITLLFHSWLNSLAMYYKTPYITLPKTLFFCCFTSIIPFCISDLLPGIISFCLKAIYISSDLWGWILPVLVCWNSSLFDIYIFWEQDSELAVNSFYYSYYYLIILKLLSHCLSASSVAVEKLVVSLITAPLMAICLFSLAALKIFSLFMIFSSFSIKYQGFPLFNPFGVSWICQLMYLIRFRKVSAINPSSCISVP